MLNAIAEGIVVGFALAFLIGPVFFLLIDISVNRGLRFAVLFAFGVMVSDAMCATIAQLGLSKFASTEIFRESFGIIGGLILMIVGIFNIIKKPTARKKDIEAEHAFKLPLRFALQGFTLNTFNPFAIIFWLGVSTSIAPKKYSGLETFIFFFTALMMVFATDSIKAVIAEKLQRIITIKILLWMNRISGIALFLFGVQVLVKTFVK